MTETPQQDRVNTENLRDYSHLRRSISDRKVAGVAGGLGRHLNVDPTVLRVAFVVLCFFGGAGFVLYAAVWLFVPEDGRNDAPVTTSSSTRNALLIGAGILAAVLLVGDSWGGFGFPWPLLPIGLVVLIFVIVRDQRSNRGPEQGNEATVQYSPQYSEQTPPPWMPPAQQAYQPPPSRPDRGPKLFWITLALVAVALGTLGLYDASAGGVVHSAYPALALTVVGAMLVLGAWVGRAGGLIFLGIVAAIALAVSGVADHARWQVVDAHPTSAAMVHSDYSMLTGRGTVDLSQVADVDALGGRTIKVEMVAGRILVVLPPDVDVNLRTEINGAGDISAPTADPGRLHHESGGNLRYTSHVDGGTDVPEMNLNVEAVAGSIEVRTS